MIASSHKLEEIFGKKSTGATAAERARSSTVTFVRSQDELSLYKKEATGRQLSAWEALNTFGLEILEEAIYEGSAILVDSQEEPARTFKARREALGLSLQDIAKVTGVSKAVVADIENPKKRTAIRYLEVVAQHLGLDERKITFQRGLSGDNQLALRLKDLSKTVTRLKPISVIAFNEIAWIIAVEDRLREWLGLKSQKLSDFLPSDEYGNASHRAWQVGYELAEKTRTILKIPHSEPINSLRELCIEKLALPVVQCELPSSIAGATIANNKSRGIVVNISGRNDNVWIRRATIAHELGHLIWDPEQSLERIRVDDYTEIDEGWSSDKAKDYVEQRANAFAAEFLAPKDVAAIIYQQHGLRAVMEQFGVSFTLARYQVWNGLYRTEELNAFSVLDVEPTHDWTGRESFTTDFFPIKNVPTTRRGYFAGLVTLAEMKNLISKDTALQYLRCSNDEYEENKNDILSLFNLSS